MTSSDSVHIIMEMNDLGESSEFSATLSVLPPGDFYLVLNYFNFTIVDICIVNSVYFSILIISIYAGSRKQDARMYVGIEILLLTNGILPNTPLKIWRLI